MDNEKSSLLAWVEDKKKSLTKHEALSLLVTSSSVCSQMGLDSLIYDVNTRMQEGRLFITGYNVETNDERTYLSILHGKGDIDFCDIHLSINMEARAKSRNDIDIGAKIKNARYNTSFDRGVMNKSLFEEDFPDLDKIKFDYFTLDSVNKHVLEEKEKNNFRVWIQLPMRVYFAKNILNTCTNVADLSGKLPKFYYRRKIGPIYLHYPLCYQQRTGLYRNRGFDTKIRDPQDIDSLEPDQRFNFEGKTYINSPITKKLNVIPWEY